MLYLLRKPDGSSEWTIGADRAKPGDILEPHKITREDHELLKAAEVAHDGGFLLDGAVYDLRSIDGWARAIRRPSS